MAKKINQLSARTIETLTKSGKHHDGSGLYLKITPTGSKSWLLRYQIGGRVRDMGLGQYPAITLQAARKKAATHRTQLAERVDPLEARKVARAAPPKRVTFGQLAMEEMRERQDDGDWRNDKTRAAWKRGIEEHLAPLADVAIEDVSTATVAAVLRPIWTTRPVTADNLRMIVEAVWTRAKLLELVPETKPNPATWKGRLEKLLPEKHKPERHASLPYMELPAYFARLREQDSVLSWLMQFTILTAARSGESRGALWSDITLNNGKSMWRIPGARMKGEEDHEVPLVRQAREILTRAADIKRDGDDFVFPGQRIGRPFSDAAFREIRPAGMTTHGFRSTFKTWAKETTDFDRDAVELSLAHSLKMDKTEKAYFYGMLLPKRRALMTAWAEFCCSNVVDNCPKLTA